MDAQDLFKSFKEKETVGPQHQRLIGLSDSLAYLPLIYGLNHNLIEHDFVVSFGTLNENAVKLREGEIELGLISSFDYALKKETWKIAPNLCISSPHKIKDIQLFFNIKDSNLIGFCFCSAI